MKEICGRDDEALKEEREIRVESRQEDEDKDECKDEAEADDEDEQTKTEAIMRGIQQEMCNGE